MVCLYITPVRPSQEITFAEDMQDNFRQYKRETYKYTANKCTTPETTKFSPQTLKLHQRTVSSNQFLI